mgnify:FL=1
MCSFFSFIFFLFAGQPPVLKRPLCVENDRSCLGTLYIQRTEEMEPFWDQMYVVSSPFLWRVVVVDFCPSLRSVTHPTETLFLCVCPPQLGVLS